MERYADRAIEIINDLHTERLDYESEYLPLIDCANRCKDYEDTGLAPEDILTGLELANVFCALNKLKKYEALGTLDELKALQEKVKQEQPNEALTLEELREMDGKPVWVQDLLISRCSAWHFAIKHDGEIRLFDAVAFGRQIVGYNATTGENYGKTWLAYRSKPEQEANRNG